MRQLMDKKDLSQTTVLNEQVKGLMQWLFCEPNPIAINTALMMTEAVPKNIRLPYHALTLEQRKEGLAILEAIDSKELIGDSLLLLQDSDFNYCV